MKELSFSPPAERNKQVILEALLKLLPEKGVALEIACGTGQHVQWFATHLPRWNWQPTDLHADEFDSVRERIRQSALTNVKPPQILDVLSLPWRLGGDGFFDLIYCANMLHIAPWPCCAALMRGAAQHLAPGGMLVTYGPYLEDEVPTCESNLRFDASLRARNPDWGIRRREEVEQQALQAGLGLSHRLSMPANNLLLVWQGVRMQT